MTYDSVACSICLIFINSFSVQIALRNINIADVVVHIRPVSEIQIGVDGMDVQSVTAAEIMSSEGSSAR